ncbi:protease-4 [Halovenus aranensis]|uniref:Protease-4 n=1 Tax=Halovenus aranensis TaxID=890420 RepID=A0A1G8WMB9_9EURY|nr:signal peptide peptidase SppA [Halovenus aranensis]SDJ79247.1 protease-4 [Halovenus aranensis]
MSTVRTLGRLLVVLVGAGLAAGIGIGLVWAVPEFTALGLLDTLLVTVVAVGGLVFAGRLAGEIFPGYNVAEVEVDDVITRDGDGGGPLPVGGGAASADDIVDQIEKADEDGNAEALIVKLNTPGGAVVPSEDIRRAAEEFDGPTVAYAEDMAASGGYWIASGCDEFHAREASIVGSIGVVGSQLGRTGLAEKAGLDYRRFVAGEYKDSPSVWRELEDREVEYFQGLLDDWYDAFVETVVDGRGLDEEFVRDTEARIYIGEEAAENGLVDTCGPREEMEDRLAETLGVDGIEVETFEPDKGVTDRIGAGARSVARAFGAGVASVIVGDDVPRIRT